MAEKNLIQVFGLPRSGTNFMEWTIVNNFKDIPYKNLYDISNVEDFYSYGEEESVKHIYPTLEYSEYALIIFKTFRRWVNSMDKYGREVWAIKKVYDTYLEKAKSLDPEKTLIVNHKYVVNNYFETLDQIAKKFNIEQVEDPIQPKYRMDRSGANASQTSKVYNDN